MKNLGKWLFIAGVLLSILSGYVDWPTMPTVLIGLGIIVGLVNINTKETTKFLISTIALLVVGTAGVSALFSTGALGGSVQLILNDFISFVAASAFIVALRTIIGLESDEK
jgi:hypothetical protein